MNLGLEKRENINLTIFLGLESKYFKNLIISKKGSKNKVIMYGKNFIIPKIFFIYPSLIDLETHNKEEDHKVSFVFLLNL